MVADQLLRFEFSTNALEEALSRLGVTKDGVRLQGTWPGRRDWSPVTEQFGRKVGAALPADDEAEITKLLDACEDRAAAHLAQAEGPARSPVPAGLLADLERLSHLIRGRDQDLHATLPHFPRWFFLHLGALAWSDTTPEEWDRAKRHGIKLWNEGLRYVMSAAAAMYAARGDHIVLESTALPPVRHYVFDTLTKLPLTPMMEDDLVDALAKCRYVRIKRARAAVVDGGFAEIIHALQAIIEGVRVEQSSDIQVLRDPGRLWAAYREELRMQEQWAERNALPATDEVAVVAVDVGATPHNGSGMARDLTIGLSTLLIGALPIPGSSFVAAGVGLYLQWLLPGPPQRDWPQIRREIEARLRMWMADVEANSLSQWVTNADDRLDRFLKEFVYKGNPQTPEGQPLDPYFFSMLLSAIDASGDARTRIMNPQTGLLTSLPFVENWFCTLALAHAHGARNQTHALDHHRELRELFNQVNDYFIRLDDECYRQQQKYTDFHYSTDCCGNHVQMQHFNRRAGWQRLGGRYGFYGTHTNGFRLSATERAYTYERAHLVTYAMLAAERIILNVSMVMERCNPIGWDRRTPRSIYESSLLPRNWPRRVQAWNNLVDFRNFVNFDEPLAPGIEAQNDSEAMYRNPVMLPRTEVDP